jgi:hypothetical protein
VKGTQVIQEDGRLRVLAEVGSNGLHRQRRHERIPAIRLRPNDIDPRLARQEITGHRPRACRRPSLPGEPGPHISFLRGKARMSTKAAPSSAATIVISSMTLLPWRTTGRCEPLASGALARPLARVTC